MRCLVYCLLTMCAYLWCTCKSLHRLRQCSLSNPEKSLPVLTDPGKLLKHLEQALSAKWPLKPQSFLPAGNMSDAAKRIAPRNTRGM